MTSSRLVWDRRGSDGGRKSAVSGEVGVVGEWKVAPFLRIMLVLSESDPAAERVTGVLRGLGHMLPASAGVPQLYGPEMDGFWAE